MLMPIVSMNKMAMNESVAATCCYREVASPTNVYWEVLNGGWIGSGYVMDLSVIHNSFTGWTQLSYDVTGSLNSNGAVVYAMPELVKATDPATGSSYYEVRESGNLIGTPLAQWWGTQNVWRMGSTCDHKDGTCYYKTEEAIYKTNQHFDAKTSHTTGGSNWNKPHNAKQYNS